MSRLPLTPARLSDELFGEPGPPAYARRLALKERRQRTWIVVKFAVCMAIIAAYFWESRDTFPRIPGAIERIFGEKR
jgi:hypothetical protein